MKQFSAVLMIISIFPLAYGKIMMYSYRIKSGSGSFDSDFDKFRKVYFSGWGIFGLAVLLILV